MSNPANLSMNKYRVEWMETKHKNGFFKKQSVVVLGEDAVKTVMETIAVNSKTVDVIPVLGE